MKRAAVLLALIFAGLSLARAQSAPFLVNSRIDDVKVYIDSVAIGSTPLSGASISPGNHIVRYCHPDNSRWPVSVVVETLNVTSATPVERTVTFPAVYHFTSEPYGASIRIADSTIGTTPMYYAGFLGGQVIVFSKPGYDDGSVLASADGGEVYSTLAGDGSGPERSSLRISDQSKSLVPIIVASGTAVISGSMAAYFKIRADKSYDEYIATGNPGALTRVDTFDKYSAVALVASQLSVIALSYLLLSK